MGYINYGLSVGARGQFLRADSLSLSCGPYKLYSRCQDQCQVPYLTETSNQPIYFFCVVLISYLFALFFHTDPWHRTLSTLLLLYGVQAGLRLRKIPQPLPLKWWDYSCLYHHSWLSGYLYLINRNNIVPNFNLFKS